MGYKKRIILYGVKKVELRREVEFFLDEKLYEIIGYTDGHYTDDYLEKKRFIPLDKLSEEKFDFIVLLNYKEQNLTDMKARLIADFNIDPCKVIIPMILIQKDAEKNNLDIINDINQNYKGQPGLIFGLSYSLTGIRKDSLKQPYYDCSWSALDLYYNYYIYKYLEQKDILQSVKFCLLVFPYYYFTYDVSYVKANYESGYLFSVWRLDKWHNYIHVQNGKDYIESYRMFGQKISRFYHQKRWENSNQHIYRDGRAINCPATLTAVSNIWFKNYPSTVEENRIIFFEFLDSLYYHNIKTDIVIPPFFTSAFDEQSHAAIQEKKEQFYAILREYPLSKRNIRVFDYFERFSDKQKFFLDLTHLNEFGARAFTELLNQEVLS